jgi:hypothetical protein
MELSDVDKLLASLSTVTSIRSINDILAIFGLDTLPTAQKYGIFFGIVTFTVTVSTVVFLLVAGGSFKRIAQQEENGGATVPCAIEERLTRPLLLERLLEASTRMMASYSSTKKTTTKQTSPGRSVLVQKLVNIAPNVTKAKEVMGSLIHEDEADETVAKKIKEKKQELKKYMPDGYEQNYVLAYRKCQQKPGGELIVCKLLDP